MSDGILKSNPEEIWKYYVNLNKNLGYIKETVQEIQRTIRSLDERLDKKSRILLERMDEHEKRKQILLKELLQCGEDKERGRIQGEIDKIEKELHNFHDIECELIRAKRRLPDMERSLVSSRDSCSRTFSSAKRVIGAYLRLIEEHEAIEGFQECEGGFGDNVSAMQYRGTTFYSTGNTFEASAENIARMQAGHAPIGYDGKTVELHHLIQSESGSIVEISGSMHKSNHGPLHINTRDIPTGIDRSSFNVLRSAYWKRRAKTFG